MQLSGVLEPHNDVCVSLEAFFLSWHFGHKSSLVGAFSNLVFAASSQAVLQ